MPIGAVLGPCAHDRDRPSVQALSRELAAACARAERAERELARLRSRQDTLDIHTQLPHGASGDRIREMLRLAAEEAEDLRAAARQDAERVLRLAQSRSRELSRPVRPPVDCPPVTGPVGRPAGAAPAGSTGRKADATAEELLATAQRDADRVRRTARDEANRVLATSRRQAEDQASTLLADAQAEADRVLRTAVEVRDRRDRELAATQGRLADLRRQVEELEVLRDTAHQQLRGLVVALPEGSGVPGGAGAPGS